MNCCIKLVTALSLASIISALRCSFLRTVVDGKRHSWPPRCVVHVFGHVHAQIPEKHKSKTPSLHCKTKTLLVSSDIRVGKSRWGGWCGASPVVSDVRTHLDKSFVSAEGWNVRLCCGFEVQINVRREVSALCYEGEMVGWVGWG